MSRCGWSGCKVRINVLVSTSTPLNQVRINALPAHGFIREDGSVGVVTVDPCIEIPRPLLGIGSLQVGNGNGLHGLFGKFQHPLLKAQPTRPRPGLKHSFFLRRQIECDSHSLQPYVFRLTQSLYIRNFGRSEAVEGFRYHLVGGVRVVLGYAFADVVEVDVRLRPRHLHHRAASALHFGGASRLNSPPVHRRANYDTFLSSSSSARAATNSLSAVASASESLFTARERAANRTAALSSGCWNLPKRVQERRSGMATQKISGGSLQISSLGWVECVPDLACRREGVKLCSCVFRDSRACCSGRTSEAWFARGER